MNYFKTKETFKKAFNEKVKALFLVDTKNTTIRQRYISLGVLVKEYLADDWQKTIKLTDKANGKEVHYFSMEFLIGRLITNNLMSLGIREVVEEAFEELGFDLGETEAYEKDPGLGNGGLGRLAACFLDSLASLGYPGYGNTIRYRYGLFRQKIKNGYQEERPDNWLSDGYVWEIRQEELAVEIPFFGYVEYASNGMIYHPSEYIKAVPYDIPIVGYKNNVINYLRAWNAEPASKYPNNKSAMDYEFDLQRITGFLYPDDQDENGKRLRLMQQYFFSSAGVKSICAEKKKKYGTLTNLAQLVTFHINDTHPTLVIPELMRILLDEEGMGWDEAWEITKNACAYTNHTILAEALEKWPIHLIQQTLPRIYQIIEEINKRFMNELYQQYPGRDDIFQKVAIINNGCVHMANLCIVGCFSVNGVAKLHTEILKNIEMKEFNEIFPTKFNNKTNGITHRRWMVYSNKELTEILSEYTPGWIENPELLKKLREYKCDPVLQTKIEKMKLARKVVLANRIYKEQKLVVDPNSIFDVQVKRLHEYKRQLLNALHIMDVYNHLKEDDEYRKNYYPHTFVFGAKAASGYYFAKKVIKLINTIAKKVNNDPETNDYLKVCFVENYNVSYAEVIMPSCDVSEQISTASKEASGTGNMKFMANGAITIGTLDGANVEINENVGSDNIFIFGLNADEVNEIYRNKSYNPWDIYQNNPDLHRVIDQLINGFFNEINPNEFKPIYDNLVYDDRYLVLKDYDAYKEAQKAVNETYKNRSKWLEMSIVNIAESGAFSSDRTIKEYVNDIWHIKPIK